MTWTYSKFLHSYTLERNGTPIAWVLQTDDGFRTDLGNGRVLGTYSTPEEAQQAAERQLEDDMAHETEHTLDLQEGEPMEEPKAATDTSWMDDDDPGMPDEPEPDATADPELPKKQRKPRADKGKPRGPRKPKPEAPAPAPAKAKRGRKAKASSKPLDAVDPDLLAVAEYIAKRDALRDERDNLNLQIDELMDRLSER